MESPHRLALVSAFVLLSMAYTVSASAGDTSPVQRKCISECHSANCSTPHKVQAFESDQSAIEYWLLWSCLDECKYTCMWRTIGAFHRRGLATPQFHGKWPFLRIFGVQEPASALFSVFNLLPHVYFLRRFRNAVSGDTRMYNVWTLYGLVSLNTWIWSTVFHTRDFDFTEKMDYFCAFSIVTYSLLAFLLRLVGGDTTKSLFAIAGCCALFARHVYNMAFVHFDYGYNMTVNISVGAVNSVCWCTWSLRHWRSQPHVRTALLAVILINVTVLLELLDFPPLLWIFDSHSLWHLSTAPIHVLWYKFAIEDCQYLEQTALEDRKSKQQKLA